MRRTSTLLAVCLAGCTAPVTDKPGDTEVDTSDRAPRNVVLVLSDDQPFTTMWAMPVVTERLLPEAVSFERAYVTVPMCCPMRASLLSGGWYPKDTGVLTNGVPMGGATAFADTDTIATRLQEAGVATALMGKYLNDYEAYFAPYVPPGWDEWVVSGAGDGAYEQSMVVGSSGPNASSVGTLADTGGEHLTSYLVDRALAFVDAQGDKPYFLLLAPNSPHLSGSPATEDLALYEDYKARPTAFDEADVSDKPAWLQAEPPLSPSSVTSIDANARTMLRNLASLDREVGVLLDGLEERGALDDTVFIYASDNGYLNGEHRLALKGLPYEESVRVPFIVRAPGVEPRVDTRLVAVNLDLAATVLDLMGLHGTGEGKSLWDAVADPTVATRNHVYMDNYTTGAPVWAGVVTDKYKYVEWSTGETEIYDLSADPYEMESLHAAPPAGAELERWGAMVDEHRGLAVVTETLPGGNTGVPYRAHVVSWGGTDPVIFSVEGTLPTGLTLGGGGILQGIPTEPGEWVFGVWAHDASVSPWSGEAQAFSRALRITVGEALPEAMMARTSETTARLVIHARPGVSVQVRATPERVPEGMLRVSDTVVAGADGQVTLTLEGLRPDRDWYWVAYFDGIPGRRGVVPGGRVW